jgi:hypothetical protein
VSAASFFISSLFSLDLCRKNLHATEKFPNHPAAEGKGPVLRLRQPIVNIL